MSDKIGDYAEVTIGTNDPIRYVITKIDPEFGIYISDDLSINYLLVPTDNDSWQVFGLDSPHTVYFHRRIALTGNKDVDKMILSKLKGSDLINSVNIFMPDLLLDEYFWRMKLITDYPGINSYNKNSYDVYAEITKYLDKYSNRTNFADKLAVLTKILQKTDISNLDMYVDMDWDGVKFVYDTDEEMFDLLHEFGIISTWHYRQIRKNILDY